MPRKNSAAIEGAGAATVALSGIHALIRIPLDQHRADKLKGLRTATLISGYQGSPLGGIDLTLEANPKLLSDHEIVFISGLNEDLGATAVMGSQLANLMDNKKYDGVCGMRYGKAPGVDRSGDAFKHANFAGVGLDRKIPLGEWVDPVFKVWWPPVGCEVPALTPSAGLTSGEPNGHSSPSIGISSPKRSQRCRRTPTQTRSNWRPPRT